MGNLIIDQIHAWKKEIVRISEEGSENTRSCTLHIMSIIETLCNKGYLLSSQDYISYNPLRYNSEWLEVAKLYRELFPDLYREYINNN